MRKSLLADSSLSVDRERIHSSHFMRDEPDMYRKARNARSRKTIEKLLKESSHYAVASGLLDNPRITTDDIRRIYQMDEILSDWVNSGFKYIRFAKNPKTPDDIIIRMLKADPITWVPIAERDGLPQEVIDYLLTQKYVRKVKETLCQNLSIPEDVRTMIALEEWEERPLI